MLASAIIYHPHNLTVGRGSVITAYCQINAGGGIEIGEDVLIGPGVMIWSQNHGYASGNLPINEQGYVRKPVRIEDDVWVGAGAIVLPGVVLAKGSVIAAGSVVTKSTEPYSVSVGVPAGIQRYREMHVSAESVSADCS